MRMLFLFFLFSFVCCTSPDKTEVVDANIVKNATGKSIESKSYSVLKAGTLAKREDFRTKYNAAKGNATSQNKILQEAQNYLIDISEEYFVAWHGTPWDFNGHTTIPREGKIACGYLVTIILKDMGFNIPRVKWAQQTSSYIVKKTSTNVKAFSNQSMNEVEKYLKASGEGLYIVGLDSHVGFIYYKDSRMSFVHANYYKPEIGVMSEKLVGWNPLSHSKYRIIGKIFQKEMVKNWILYTAYSV